MTDIDERLARALAEAVPQPPRELDPESLRTALAEGPRRGLLAPVLAAAAVVAVAVGLVFATDQGDERTATFNGGPGPVAGPTNHANPVGPVAHPARLAAHVVARLLAAAPTVPGATPADSAPVKVLKHPMEMPVSSNFVHRTRWWTAPGTMAAAIAYFDAHPPAGTQSFGTSSSNGPGVSARGVSFDATARRWLRPTVYTQLKLLVEVAPAPGGVGIRVDTEAIWLPQRTPGQHIPSDVTSVDVVVDRKGRAPTVRRALGAADARSLASVVNGLRVFAPGQISCPIDFGWTDTLGFHSSSGELRVVARVGGCAPVYAGAYPGARKSHNPTLSGGGAVDRAVLRALGLPRDYGR